MHSHNQSFEDNVDGGQPPLLVTCAQWAVVRWVFKINHAARNLGQSGLSYVFTGSGFTVRGYLSVCASHADRSFVGLAYMPAST